MSYTIHRSLSIFLILPFGFLAHAQVEQNLDHPDLSKQDIIRVKMKMVKGNGPFGYGGTLLSTPADDPKEILYGLDERVNFTRPGYDDYIFSIGSLETNFLLNLHSKVELGKVKPEALERY